MRGLFLFILAHLPLFCVAQTDSAYIRSFDYRLAVRTFIGKDYISMRQQLPGGAEREFNPNNPFKIGLGLALKNTLIDVSYGISVRGKREKGETKASDLQLHGYGRKFVFDLFLQKYHGFYDDSSGEITIYPDLEICNYGASALYIFNNSKYSYKAAFKQNEKQLRSAGSFLAGIGAYYTTVRSDSSFVHKGRNDLYNTQLNISAGYAYTWVLGRYWDISASTTVGVGFGFRKFKDIGKAEISPAAFPRVTAGYIRGKWSVGFAFVGNIIFPTISQQENVRIMSGRAQLSYTRRFGAIPFFEKSSR